MEVYLVGGAVRDALLGRPVSERDWVVVGATPEAMEARGFRPVGKDFPVFLHPETHEEYALARTERKTGRGYHGFSFHAAPDVTLDDDLVRRDLTVNAMAQRPDGTLVDPFNGHADLEARLLRHVSDAFQEDPVRILRLARFTARYTPLGFRPADETMALCQRMVADGEVDHLVPERVWQELEKTLSEPCPSAFFHVLRHCGALARLIPELDAAFGLETRTVAGRRANAAEHALTALDTAAGLDEADGPVKLALVLGALDHEDLPPEAVHTACRRLRAPNAYQALAQNYAAHRHTAHGAETLSAEGVLQLLHACDAFRRPERFSAFLLAVSVDAATAGVTDDARDYTPARRLRACLDATRGITGGRFADEGLKGPAIAEAVRAERLRVIAALEA
nr:multifunctional CCA addition/repair protein [Aquisalimonas asiatica]